MPIPEVLPDALAEAEAHDDVCVAWPEAVAVLELEPVALSEPDGVFDADSEVPEVRLALAVPEPLPLPDRLAVSDAVTV